jgi:hypothetical protein
MRITSRARTVVAAGIAASLVSIAPASAVTAVGSGNVRGFQGVQVVGLPDTACTTSFPFTPMPGMSLKLSLKRRGPIVVMFQGQFGGAAPTAGARTALRIVVDGVVVGSAIAIGNDNGPGLETFGFNSFSTTPLGAGSHTVDVLWHTFPAGAESCVEERSLIVLHP